MPLIKNGAEAKDDWRFPETFSALGDGKSVLTLNEFLANIEAISARNTAIGVRLMPEDDPTALATHLDKVSLIEISFPKYTDGRGYSQAQLLRRRHGYSGELRAVGHVLRDQILYMNRSGFDAYQTSRADLSHIVEALSEYSAFYQPAADGHRSVFARRHEKV